MTTEENEEQASEKTWGVGLAVGKKFCSFHTSLPSPSLPLAWEPKMLEIQMFKINSLANTSPRWNVPWKISQIWYIWNNLPRLNILFHMQMYTLSINRSSRISGQHCVFFLSFFQHVAFHFDWRQKARWECFLWTLYRVLTWIWYLYCSTVIGNGGGIIVTYILYIHIIYSQQLETVKKTAKNP